MAETPTKELSVSQYLNSDLIKINIEQTLADKAPQFIASVASLATNNKMLALCNKKSLLAACLTAASLDLPINPNLGFAYIIPYKNGKTGEYEAQFQAGWRAFVQLGQRSGQYKTINVTDVREGEIAGYLRLEGENIYDWVRDDVVREKTPVVGYVAYFELLNGFKKSFYMSSKELESHAKRYSQSYRANSAGMNKWKDDFDVMAKKTVLKLLISKYGPMTVEMQKAIISDQSVEKDGRETYVDNQATDPESFAYEKEKQRISDHIEAATSLADLDMVEEFVGEYELSEKYDLKRKEVANAK